MTNSQSQVTAKMATKVQAIMDNIPDRQPREDEIEYQVLDKINITYIKPDGSKEYVKGIEVAIFFDCVFDRITKKQIGLQLNEEDGSSSLMLFDKNRIGDWGDYEEE